MDYKNHRLILHHCWVQFRVMETSHCTTDQSHPEINARINKVNLSIILTKKVRKVSSIPGSVSDIKSTCCSEHPQ